MFNSSRALGVAYRGISLETLFKDAGSGFGNTVNTASTVIENKYPAVVEGRIQGSKPHHSSRDRNDPKKVVTVGYHTKNGTRLLSIHAHEDGTWKEFISRAGRSASATQSTHDSPPESESQGDHQSKGKA
ncbi:uncharacterized protein BO97DRAFT_403005 [Aspergillus homomorphus CBS 101889]|uniref:Uncharacterized protein n=1 Tax=Aspergillus homomorphus (strain CBS 101889) TaxID=1450537 RepID=A0A395I8Y6_ASPHC|nr:hypothetical protein BO97DRAFT_403005 [Aspergillus homomorphus CBS 101889]RAL15703.1 hypothetical protein BO97DRAFT_403005 [Aspergillus homomorphus CBS 101889]